MQSNHSYYEIFTLPSHQLTWVHGYTLHIADGTQQLTVTQTHGALGSSHGSLRVSHINPDFCTWYTFGFLVA